MAEGDTAQGDLLAGKDGGAAAAAAGDKATAGTQAGDATKAAAADPAKTDGAGTADTAQADPGKAAQDAKAAEPAPVDYAKTIAEVKLPDGVKLDPALAKAGADLFAEMKLPAEAAGKLVEFFAQQQKAGAEGNAKAFAAQIGAWKAEAEKSTTAEERGAAREALLKVFDKADVEVMEAFGLTNRLTVIKSLAKIAKAIKDDSFVPGNAAVNGQFDARSLYPNSQHTA